MAKLSFDGSIKCISCIMQHDDYAALTNRAVLLQVAPLQRDKDGRTYRGPTLVEPDICKPYVQCILLLCLTMLKLFIAQYGLCDDYVTCYIT